MGMQAPRIQCQDYTKCNTESDITAARYCNLRMCHREPRTGHILDWKTNEPQNMSRNIYDNFFF